jgi:NAD-dependent dihydropyrimidine dehydrogenase PreA subunit
LPGGQQAASSATIGEGEFTRGWGENGESHPVKTKQTEKGKPELNLKIRRLAAKFGGDLFGVASPDLLSAAPEGFRPQDLLAGCRSVIVVGKRLSDATVETTPSRMFDTLYFAVNSFLDQLILKIADALIREGYQAVGVGPHSLDGKQLRGDISQKHAAVAAGLGRFGLQSLVLTPQFGPRQRWGTVVTDAPLKPGIPSAAELCLPEECGRACITNCPAKIFSAPSTEGIADPNFLPGGLWYYWSVDKLACRTYRAERKNALGWVTEGGHACAVCLKVCPAGRRS